MSRRKERTLAGMTQTPGRGRPREGSGLFSLIAARMPTREQWFLGIIPLTVILYFLLNHEQFFQILAWLSALFQH